MITDQRRDRLLQFIRQRGFASLNELTGELRVSESTIRRDLDHLEEVGTAKRTHGGVFYTGPSPQLPHFRNRQEQQWDKKKEIAARAAELVEDGDVILLDGGSTTYELAQLLIARNIQVVTNSLPVANLFTASSSVDLIIVGGYVHLRTGVSLGPYANEMLSTLNVRRAFLSVAGISERGFFNSNLLLVETERAMLRAADEAVILADSTKFGRQSLALLCELNEVTQVVVDNEVTADWRSRISATGTAVLVAGLTDNG
jgi:DeoR/GlpR family transcriptional regulator of sugar metabolism